jgi:hypothetical protein
MLRAEDVSCVDVSASVGVRVWVGVRGTLAHLESEGLVDLAEVLHGQHPPHLPCGLGLGYKLGYRLKAVGKDCRVKVIG